MKAEKPDIAPEQYELFEKPSHQFKMNRRSFFEILGSGIAVTFTLTTGLSKELISPVPEDQVAAWIHVNETGQVTVYTGKAEVGQNIRTSLAQIVAEEFPVSMDKIDMVMGDTALTPYDRGTFGSRSIPYMGPQLRKAAATAREILMDMAAAKWKIERRQLFMENGVIKNTTADQSINIGELTKGEKLLKSINDKVNIKRVDEWKVAGTSIKKVRGESFVTGKHKFVSDMKLPGMLYGKVLRAPSFGASLISVDAKAAKDMNGVTVVHEGDFIGVAAPDLATASKAIKAIKAEWKTTPQPSRTEIFDYIRKHSDKNGSDEGSAGDAANAFTNAEVKIEKTFTIDYIAHAPLEPRAGLAQWANNKLTVWTGTQRPFGVQEDLAEVFNMPKENIRVIQPDTGSGYGGKHTGEAGIEAARLAKAATMPVKIVWTREEEFTWAYFRPAGVIDIKASAGKDGKLTSWEFHNHNSGGSGIETPYEVTNKKIQFHGMDSPLRQGSYRGLAATANVFARECIMNDLARELKQDPLEFRLKNLREQRMKDVLQAAAQKFGWNKKPDANHGYGIACGNEKGSYVATCAEVSIDSSNAIPKLLRVVVAFECGAIINPEHLKNQIQGAVIQGLGGALFERIDFKDGKILNASFSKYRVPRFSDTPELDVVMLNRKDIPSVGAGETPILGIAPAVRNAIDHATGRKMYGLPLDMTT
ncbi:molybdopterin cofactor-binding domain-containing protein [Chryseolinea sp. H1M3-3]|uniref:xanthine dehydrogenase family protein molybdopterin-binding subunit n=1 Tax=Chryseolinea sp. H1M3-3 TaxID=3034144 RepID=UPI0023EB899E|nr:molybdopterin cofactor-binding domain-containing protein [Chryseolinea sp. H1M3-3]